MKSVLELDDYKEYKEPENLLVVDCLNFAFRFQQRAQNDFAADYVRTIRSFANSYNAKKVILVADSKSSAYRLNVDANYKSGRKERRKDQTEEERQKFIEFFEGYEAALELAATQFDLLRFDYVEADDLAAYLVKEISPLYPHTWLISTDGDWDLLLNENVSRFGYGTRKEYTIDNFYDNHGCDNPEQFVSLKVLQGDDGDSIDGIEGVGAKRAYNLIVGHGSAMDIFDSMPLDGKQKFIQNINNSGDRILLNYELIDLLSFCEDAIAFPDADNLEKMMEYCNEIHECNM